MREIYSALDDGSTRLAMMGIRAVIDVVTTQSVGDIGSFAKKLTALQAAGSITQSEGEMLNAALDAGSAAAHRGHVPTPGQTQTALDIVEHVLEKTYRLASAADSLKKSTPPRRTSS
jgi:hypothetical protein